MNNMLNDTYVIGEKGLCDELSSVGIKCSGLEDNHPSDDILDINLSETVKNVVVGLDFSFNFKKLSKAMIYINHKNCKYIATNTDATFPLAPNLLIPGAGAIVRSVSCGVGHGPDVLIGKPSKYMMEIILRQYNLDPKTTMMVGDRLETDINFGNDVFIIIYYYLYIYVYRMD